MENFTKGSSVNNSYGQQDSGYREMPDFYAMSRANANSDTEFFTLFKGAIGAIIGAVPGFFMIMTLARSGLIGSICGVLLSAGVFFGYYIATHRSGFKLRTGGIICLIVMGVAVYLAVRTSWVHEVQIRLAEMSDILGFDSPKSSSYISKDVVYDLILGNIKPTYSLCSENFSELLSDLRMESSFKISLIENYFLCAVGSVWLFYKFGRKNY
ncbi:MAG: hypothetical protein K6G33_12940 [Ruminococcus sp.]|uniref:hypothetical protein n=1 Tax=Ruminococcus sp. TaxID=41978 RepID=UPI0025CC79C3|nr:hypothetical protein [Ruminococcus sp.]MCR5601636.1 hypothetical protein [Ruminococcus sp.]